MSCSTLILYISIMICISYIMYFYTKWCEKNTFNVCWCVCAEVTDQKKIITSSKKYYCDKKIRTWTWPSLAPLNLVCVSGDIAIFPPFVLSAGIIILGGFVVTLECLFKILGTFLCSTINWIWPFTAILLSLELGELFVFSFTTLK